MMKILTNMCLVTCLVAAAGCKAKSDEMVAEPEAETPAAASDETKAEATEPEGDVPSAEKTNVGETLYFATDSAEPSEASKEPIKEMCDWLKDNENRDIVIHGYADDRGDEDYNKELGKKRAEAIRNSLADCGASEDRIAVVSHGEKGPELSQERERRVVFTADDAK